MRRVRETIDAWYDSGSMPFAQFHYPFEGEELFTDRFPADFISEAIDQTRGWFYSLLAVSVLVFDRASYRNCVVLGLILDPEGQKMSKSRGNVVDPWEVIGRHGADAFRWYYFTAQQPWAGYRFSADTVGESVRQFMLTLWNTYAFWVLYANAEGSCGGSRSPDAGAGAEPARSGDDLDRWALSRLQGTIADGDRAHGSVRLHDGRPRDRRLRRGALQLVRAALAPPLLGGRPRSVRHPAPVPARRVAALLAPFTPFMADEIYANLAGGEAERSSARCRTPFTCATSPSPTPRSSTSRSRLRWRPFGARSSWGARRARKPRSRSASRCAGRSWSPTTPSGRQSRARSKIVTSELNVKELEFVAEESELVTLRGEAQLPRARPPLRQADAPGRRRGRGPRLAARSRRRSTRAREVGINVEGREHALGPDDLTLVLQPLDGYQVEASAGHAVALALELDDELRREGLAREIVHAVQNARRESGLEVTDRIELSLAGDAELLDAARAHEAYVAGETLATSVSYDGAEAPATEIGGRELRIALERSA